MASFFFFFLRNNFFKNACYTDFVLDCSHTVALKNCEKCG